MAKQKLIHIKSAVKDKKPLPGQLEYGQISVNYNADNPFLAIKDTNDEVVSIPSEKAIEGLVNDDIQEVLPSIIEEVIPTVIGENYYTKQQTDAEINALSAATDTKLEGKADVSDIPSLDGYATESWVQEQGYLTEHQSLDDYYTKTESDSKYAEKGDVPTDVYTKAETDAEISGATHDMATKTWVGQQGYLTEHQSLDNYYTKDQTSGATQIATALSYKANLTDIPDVSGYFDDAQYDSNTQRINFYHGNTIEAYIDATPFIVSGLIDDVRVETISGTTYLVIDFDTQSGKQDILIPITEIFNPDNYYTKDEVDTEIGNATQDMATETWVTSQGYLTQHQSLDNYYTKAQVDSEVSGATADMATKTWVGEQGYLTQHQSLDNYYTKDQTSGATQIAQALEGKVDDAEISDMATKTWVGEQGYLTQHQDISGLATKQEVETLSAATDTKLSGKQDTLTAGDNITIENNVISATGGGGSSYTAGTNMEITSGGTINCTIPVSYGRGSNNTIFGTDITNAVGGYRYRLGIGNQIKFTAVRSDGSIGIAVASTSSGSYSEIYGGNSIGIGRTFKIGTADNPSGVANQAIAIGHEAQAKKDYSIALGSSTVTDAQYSVALGCGVKANAEGSFNCGKYNIGQTDTLFELGNGAYNSSRSNAVEVKNNGDVYILLEGQMVKLQDHLGGGGGSVTIDPALDPASPNAVANSAITASLSSKQDTLTAGEGITISGNTISATGGGGGGMTEDTELLLATAITDLNDRKADVSYVRNKLKNYQDKGDYVTTTALDTRLADYETALDEQNIEEVAAYALNDLNYRKQDKLVAGTGITISGNTISATGGGGGGGTQVQADWSQSDDTAVDYIKNKPDLSVYAQSSSLATVATSGSYSDLSNTPTIPTTTSSVTSGSTACIESGAVYTQFDGLQLKKITQSDYDNLQDKDSNTLYVIISNN